MSDPIVCKPTPWFLWRAVAMILMFGIFAVMFFKDAKWGYRDQNLVHYTRQAFKSASDLFGEKGAQMSPTEWKEFVAEHEILLPPDRSLLPEGTPERLPWPEVLADYDAMKEGQSNWEALLFDPYRESAGLKAKVPEHAHTARKILEQWVVFVICTIGALIGAFFLLRTVGRSMRVENGTLHPPAGKPVAITDLIRLDLRKWQSKGLAFAWAKAGGDTERRIRLDGLTYGGFKEADGEPAEKLMEAVRAGFSGELIDYERAPADES